MKRLILLFVALVLLPLQPSTADGEKKPWLDLQNCSICKHMGDHMDMMEHTTWETHKIANGMLSASVIPKKYRARMDEVHKKMMTVVAQLEDGKEMPLCGFCTSYGELRSEGAKSEEIETDFGMISMLTSDNPEVVTKIHVHADRTVKEFKAYLEAQEKAAAGASK